MVRTTQPKVDKADISSTEAPTTQALAARLGSKVPDDNPTDVDPILLNFYTVESWITWWMSSLLQLPNIGLSGLEFWMV
jgi:hypothetical protein